MKSLQSLRIARRILTSSSLLSSTSFPRLISTSPLSDTDDPTTSDFDSRHLSLPLSQTPAATKPIWNTKFRSKADRVLGVRQNAKVKKEIEEREVEKERMLARALLEAALLPPDEDEDEGEGVREEEQKSLSVGIVGAPNAGKSCLTNVMVGTKVAAVSRKTNTTTHEVLGVMTKENTQISFFDTPGITVHRSGHPYKTDFRFRVESAFNTIDLYDLLIVLFDVDRHLTKPDKRVIRLIKQLGEKVQPGQKRILCLNKIDLVKNRKDLLNVAKEFEDLPGYERHFMISGLKGSGVKDLLQYLMDQAVERPWDEELNVMSEEMMKNIALEVVREKLLDHIHQEIPYVIDHRLMDWKELRDGSLRVEQHFITLKDSQRQILVGKNGSKIGRIGIEANEELRSIFKREVHLILQVRVARRKNA